MSLTEDKGLAGDSSFMQRIEMAMLLTATQVCGEPVTAKAIVDSKRHDLSVNVTADKDTWKVRFAHITAALGTLLISSTDQQIKDAVSAVWNDIAGVSGADLV